MEGKVSLTFVTSPEDRRLGGLGLLVAARVYFGSTSLGLAREGPGRGGSTAVLGGLDSHGLTHNRTASGEELQVRSTKCRH